jgi:hypothetical protein
MPPVCDDNSVTGGALIHSGFSPSGAGQSTAHCSSNSSRPTQEKLQRMSSRPGLLPQLHLLLLKIV